MRKQKRSQLLNVARKMPPLFHTIPGQAFDILQSQVLLWLIKQPDILNFIWNNIKQSGDVFYDPKSGKWQGTDCEKEKNL